MSDENLPIEASRALPLETRSAVSGDWSYEGDSNDILIPRVLVAQFTSEVVQKPNAKVSFGNLYRSTTETPLGGKGESLEVIPLTMTKQWVVSKKKIGASKFEFDHMVPFTLANKDDAWEWTEGEFEWKRVQSLNFFVLLVSDIERDLEARRKLAEEGELPDLDDSLLPCLLSFKSTSYKAGKSLATHFAKASDYRVPPFVNTFKIDTEQQKNEQGQYFVIKVDKGQKTGEQYLTLCRKWHDLLKVKAVKIDEDSSESSQNAPSEATNINQF